MSTDTKRKAPVKRKAPDASQVLDRLERMIGRADDFVLGFVKCNHPLQQKELRREFLARLGDKRALEVELDKPLVSLLDELTARWDQNTPPDVVCVYGLEKSINELQEASPVLGRLNNDRDLLRHAIPVPLLIWLPDFALDFIARGAPDFWAWRSGVYEFVTDRTLWQQESIQQALIGDVLTISSLSQQEKRAEIAHLKELLRTAQNLPRHGKREKRLIASLLGQVGMLHIILGQWREAETEYRQSLRILNDLGDQQAIAITLHQLGRLNVEQNKLPEAERLYRQSLQISRELGDESGVAGALHQLAIIEHKRNRLTDAEHLYRQSLQINQELGNKRSVASTLQQLGLIEFYLDDLPEAERLYRQSLQISRELGDKSGIASSLHQVAMIEQRQGNLEEAERLYRHSLQINQELGDKMDSAINYGQLGRLHQERGQLRTALDHYWLAWSAFCEMHSLYLAEVARKCIQEVREQVGEEQFGAWLTEAYGPQAADIRKKIDEAPSAPNDTMQQEAAAVG